MYLTISTRTEGLFWANTYFDIESAPQNPLIPASKFSSDGENATSLLPFIVLYVPPVFLRSDRQKLNFSAGFWLPQPYVEIHVSTGLIALTSSATMYIARSYLFLLYQI